MDCLRRGGVRRGICIPKPPPRCPPPPASPSARPLFHLGNSTLWLLSTREYLWWRCPRLSHSASVARQMLAFESETLRDGRVPLGWRGAQIILTNMHEIHPPSDNLSSRGNFERVRQNMNIRLFIYFYFISASLQRHLLIWLTDPL